MAPCVYWGNDNFIGEFPKARTPKGRTPKGRTPKGRTPKARRRRLAFGVDME